MIKLNGFDFGYMTEFNMDGRNNYGYVDFWVDNDTTPDNDYLIRVYIDGFDLDTNYDSRPSSFNSETGNVGYKSYSYDTVSDVDVYTELTDQLGNIHTEQEFLEFNPELNNLSSIIEQAEQYAKELFKQWWNNQ